MLKRGIVVEPFTGAELIVATGDKDRAKICAQLGLEGESGPRVRGWVQQLHYMSGGTHIVVGLPEKRCESTLYHEALHVATEVLDLHGVPVGPDNQELLCYLQEYIVRQIDAAVYTKPRGQRKRSMTK